jgi:hypothetical protein
MRIGDSTRTGGSTRTRDCTRSRGRSKNAGPILTRITIRRQWFRAEEAHIFRAPTTTGFRRRRPTLTPCRLRQRLLQLSSRPHRGRERQSRAGIAGSGRYVQQSPELTLEHKLMIHFLVDTLQRLHPHTKWQMHQL